MRFAKNTQHDSSKVLRLPRKMKMDTSKVLRLPSKKSTRLLKTMRKYCPCHTERLSTLCETCWNVTKCHACYTKQGYAGLKPPKATTFAVLPRGTAIATSRRLQTVANTKVASREHLSTPRPQSKTRTLLYAFGKSVFWVGTTKYQPTKYAVVVVKLLQSDQMYPNESDNTSGKIHEPTVSIAY